MDMAVRTSRVPGPGETLFGQQFDMSPGGKGANQAVAAARQGGHVTMIGRVGNDAFGSELREILRQEGINIDPISASSTLATGIASIILEADGENRIIVVPGANMELSAEDIFELESVIRGAKLLVIQLEMELGVCEAVAAIASRNGIPLILNPAPARILNEQLLSQVTYLTPNETEAGLLSGMAVDSLETAELAARALIHKGVQHVIVTLGSQGALIVSGESVMHVPGFPVQAVDTVAAGDSFNGALAVQLAGGQPLEEAVRYANAAGALAVCKQGAIPSLPSLADVEQFLKNTECV